MPPAAGYVSIDVGAGFSLREQVLENYGLIFLCLRRWLVLVDLLRGAGVAPVRGGTYFLCPPRGLPSGRQRKESKQRKRAHTANPSFYPRALNVPIPHVSHGNVLSWVHCQRAN